jgi:PAS domain S-box-containing protein
MRSGRVRQRTAERLTLARPRVREVVTRRQRLYGDTKMARSGGTVRRPRRLRQHAATTDRKPARALQEVAGEGASVVVLGLEALGDECWAVLTAAGVRLVRVADVAGAVGALQHQVAQVVIAEARRGRALTTAIRERRGLASTHIVLCAALDSPSELREALDAGGDDVMRVPFEPEVLAARVAAGLRAAHLRANEALLRSLVANIPGAVYRCACDEHWTMELLSDEIETISGYPASDFIDSAVRTFTSVIDPDDREQVERSVMDAVDAGRPFELEYRIRRRDGGVRWVLERGQAQEAGDGRRWLDGAIFDITVRRAAEQALREHAIVEAQLAEVRASRARILEAADRARREIERNLHDGAQQRFVSVALQLQLCLAAHRELAEGARTELNGILADLRTGLAELRDLAHGLHPAVLSDRGLEHALASLANRASVPVALHVALPPRRFAISVEAAAYFTVCEALTNIAKYAHASRAWVNVEQRDGHLDVEVGDDGVGGADMSSGTGIQGLRDRIAAVNGTLDIDSRSGTGTVLRARLPVEPSPRHQ